jgi:hypothetical protein
VIVLLDTTVLGADYLCGGDAWQTLVLAARAWDIRVAVTEVVIAEAVANYGREVDAARRGMQGVADKRLGTLGLWEAFEASNRVLTDGAANYADRLRKRLEESGVEILPVPDFPHMELVQRATERRRPCNDKGDGYRDTLNWLTLLGLAKAEPDQRIIWVSNNTDDFGCGSGELHPDLIEDLDSIPARDRVSWKKTLADVILSLAAEHAPGSESDIKTVQEKVRNDSVLEFLATELARSATEYQIDPRLCALPVETISAAFRSLAGIRNLELVVKGLVAEGHAAAEFTVEADAGIDVVLVWRADASGADTITSTRYINKPLLLRGLVTLDEFERPVGAELAAIEARPDDPDRSQWQAYPPELQVDAETLRQAIELARSLPPFPIALRQAAETVYANQAAIRQAAGLARSINASQETIRQAAEMARSVNASQASIRQAAQMARSILAAQEVIRQTAQAARGFTSSDNNAGSNSDSGNQHAEPQSGDDVPPPDSSENG